MCFFFNDTATTEIYTSFPTRRSSDLPPDDRRAGAGVRGGGRGGPGGRADRGPAAPGQLRGDGRAAGRSEEHTSELQSRQYLVCRLLLEKKKKSINTLRHTTSNYPHDS